MEHQKKKAESFQNLIEDFVNNETFWDTRVICKDGVVRHNQVTLGLLFYSLKTSDVFNLPIESTLILPDFSTFDVQDMIKKKLADIFAGEGQTELEHTVNIEEIVSVQCKIEQEEDTNEENENYVGLNDIFNSNRTDNDGDTPENIVDNVFDSDNISIEVTDFSTLDKFSYIKEENPFISSDGMAESARSKWEANKLSKLQNKPKKPKVATGSIKPKNFKCEQIINGIPCESSFGKEYPYHRHRLDVHQITPPSKYMTFTCNEPDCNVTKMTQEQLDNHRIKSHGDIITCANGCGSLFKNATGARLHAKKCQGYGLKRIKKINQKEQCVSCGNFFANAANLKQHVDDGICGKEEGMVVKVQCPKCPKQFRYKRNMLQHKKEWHSEITQEITKVKQDLKEVCPICGKELSPKKILKHIKVVHEKVKNHFCPECGKGFFDKWDIKKHIDCVHKG